MAILREDISFRYLKQVFLVNVCFEQQDSALQVEFLLQEGATLDIRMIFQVVNRAML
jgi:polysaccharide pyruvyl transferase WcaK-like protein